MHFTLDTVAYGTGLTFLAIIILAAAFVAGLAFAIVAFICVREMPIFLMRYMDATDSVTFVNKNGKRFTYKNSTILLNIGYISLVLVNGKLENRVEEG